MKYYFQNEDSEQCFTKDYFLEYMADNDLKEMQVFPVRMIKGSEYSYCMEFQDAGETKEMCGKLNCDKYTPRNGKNGRCKYNRNCYEPVDDAITIKIK
jgi:hypothetical protein